MVQTSLFVFTITVTIPLAAASSLKFGSSTIELPSCMMTVQFTATLGASSPIFTRHYPALEAGKSMSSAAIGSPASI